MRPDNNVAAAAQLALGVKGLMPEEKARAALKSLLGTKFLRRALAALRNNTNKEEEQDNNDEEEQGKNDGEDGFILTQDDNTKDNESLHRSSQLGGLRQTTLAVLALMT
jgi:hypothetical protein